MRVELTFEPERIVAVSTMAGRFRQERDLRRSWARLSSVVSSRGMLEDLSPCLLVSAEAPCKPLLIGRGLNLPEQTLTSVGRVIDRWVEDADGSAGESPSRESSSP